LNVAYITVSAPLGYGEKFIIDEVEEISNHCNSVIIFPIRKSTSKPFHNQGRNLHWEYLPFISWTTIKNGLTIFIKRPTTVLRIIFSIIKNSHSIKNFIKNIVVLPKALVISSEMSRMHIDHIHAHWETTTSTVGYICHEITKIPWSFTVHSGQIFWNNMIEEKIRTVEFCRVISIDRSKDILQITNNKYVNKLKIIHMGVKVPACYNFAEKSIRRGDSYNIVCVANLDRIKGHQYLIEAIATVEKVYNNIVCDIIGCGSELKKLKELVIKYNLKERVRFLGVIPNELILKYYEIGKYDLFVLPSIKIEEEKREEGIPVALMEAMSYGVPVISTNTGAINELIENNVSGILVNDKDSNALAEAIIMVAENTQKQLMLSMYERATIIQNFDIRKNSKYLYDEIGKEKKQ
jgi:glycosyltransferase involved in cell wall biosynthesis